MNIKKTLLFLLSLGAATQTYATEIDPLTDSQRCYEQEIDMLNSGDGCSGDYCKRRAFICLPRAWSSAASLDELASTYKAPIVLAFHGKGKETLSDIQSEAARIKMKNAPEAGHFGYATYLHGAMPNAIVVYLQGLPITYQWLPALNPAESPDTVEKNPNDRGWQVNVGSSPSENRDLVFVNKMFTDHLASHLETGKLYAVGHSNGSRFVGVLWNRLSLPPFDYNNNMLKAIAFSAAQAGDFTLNNIVGKDFFVDSSPISIFMGMGTQDHTIEYTEQIKSIPKAKSLLNTPANPIFDQVTADEDIKLYENVDGKKLGIYIHSFTYNGSGHIWPAGQSNKIAIFFGLQP